MRHLGGLRMNGDIVLCRWFTFDGVKIASIYESEGIDESTYYRYIREACPKLSVLIFGIDGIS
jgi:hypothetical protein